MRAELASRVRYFTRDANLKDATIKSFTDAEGLPEERWLDSASPGDPKGFVIDDRERTDMEFNRFADPRMSGDEDELTRPQSFSFGAGVAGWSDFNHPGQLVRHALADAAGIVIPRANKVVVMLAIYLAILVPLNFLVFRLIGRVEWAWIAAPIITIACTVAVIHYAGLNVGFARSRTEIAVVEIQGEHPRAHVTRYTGVYTSLATSYDVEFDNPSSVIQPYAAHSRKELNDPNLFMRDSSTVQSARDDKQITLTGFDVTSNSTGMLHAEHMLDLGGGIAARQVKGEKNDTYELVNRTKLNLKGAAVLNRKGGGWLGDLGSGATRTVTLSSRAPSGMADAATAASGDWFAEREQDSITARARRDEVLKARLLVRLAENPDTLADGELRLVAWTPDELPGMEISPRASQSRYANVVVAHLRYDGPLKHGNWTLGYRNDDLRSREEEISKRGSQFEDLEMPRADLDGDGVSDVPLNPADIPAAARRFIQRYDPTRDGAVDAAEWPVDALVPLGDVDADGNNKVTAAELEAYLRKEYESLPE